ncbi:hypothetical protein R0K18_25995, partial [Pantoea sp. SIMBA_133]
MAVIKVRNTGEVIEGRDAVSAFLQQEGVLYEQWQVEKLPEPLRGNCTVTEEQKKEILTVF